MKWLRQENEGEGVKRECGGPFNTKSRYVSSIMRAMLCSLARFAKEARREDE
jgi:hypothetical protein